MKLRSWLLVILLLLPTAGAGYWVYQWWTFPVWVERQVGEIEASYRDRKFAKTVELTKELLERRGGRVGAVTRGAEAAVQLGRLDEALELIDRGLPQVNSPEQRSVLTDKRLTELHLLQAGIAFQLQRLAATEAAYRRVLALDENHLVARERLALLLVLLGRNREATPMLIELLRAGHVREPIMTVLGTSEPLFQAGDSLRRAIKQEPQSPWPHLALARLALFDRQYDAASEQIDKFLSAMPKQLDGHALSGRILLEAGGGDQPITDQMAAWFKRLPPDAETHAGIWRVQGLWSLRQGDHAAAVRCFAEAVRRDPCHSASVSQLAGSLAAVGEAAAAQKLVQYARLLEELDTRCHLLRESGASYRGVLRAAELCEKLGRYWEAYSWAKLFLRRPAARAAEPGGSPPQEYAAARAAIEALHARVTRQLEPRSPRVAIDYMGGEAIDVAAYPLPRFDSNESSELPVTPAADLTRRPHFADVTEAVGIDFRFHNADDPSTKGRRLIETTGGGVAVLDYDRDGWPDLYFCDGGPWSGDGKPSPYPDRLYRNTGQGRFIDVTESAGLGDRGFSQGVAVGDIDNDGWPDLLVCNLGRNRLYRNNGDGTFSDITESAGLLAEHWSTSAAIADVNRDGIPDIYVVNYLAGERAYHHICGARGVPRVCSPADCEAAPDQFYLGLGDGRWENRTAVAGVDGERGNGLGCIVSDLLGDGRTSVFVANDATANFCYVNQGAAGREPRFEETAVLWGLAYSSGGRSQGCMGVAAGDFDLDSRLDLFVTNFYRESNALYRQRPGGVFTDEAVAAGIADVSESLLGFGTQFLDAELDGLLDLVLVNGHIDDLTDQGVAYRMPAQYLRNLGGRFAEWPAQEAGDYFQRRVLGRGLARIDWNLDGKPEFVVSHLDDGAVLMENRTENAGHFLAVELAGTTSARDAVGAIVTLTANGRKYVRQLTAGDGYMASNHRRIIFGLGKATKIERLEVRWPSGVETELGPLDADRTVHVVENEVR